MFEPYEISHGIEGLRFYVGNQQGADWYDPLKPYALLEYQWVRDNIDFAGKRVADCGAHHGNYSIVFKGADLVCIEPVPENVAILQKNLELNGIDNATVIQGLVKANNLHRLAPDVDIVKMDIEGDEFKALPGAINQMPDVTTWIVEIHPPRGNPNKIIDAFIKRGFEVLNVDVDLMQVIEYQTKQWKRHGTIIARRCEQGN